MIVCEVCCQIIDESSFWVHKHNEYLQVDAQNIIDGVEVIEWMN